ncbi:MAG: bifunctional precorrin-2 dehydrogenase/sirohydrochlorin ferrochelatase [Nitrospira sp.]|nr:bifunctional precorrin-2 dehydrogenase/sirohydrochlorin ferrochelatase [bacterium]MBL7048682.1 bifunctional precorrin-2 dehydrogenase/sirohydrochlorin ferrochelatase [Nitrospira sp.]
MKYYPAYLDLNEKKVMVIGGGKVAERKVRLLLKAGAVVTIISPELSPGLHKLQDSGLVRYKARPYRRGDLTGVFLVIACTSSKEVNARVAAAAENLINVIDDPALGNFIVPSVVKKGPLTVAVSTEGASPAVSKAIRKEIELMYDAEFGQFLKFTAGLRQEAVEQITDRKQRERFLKSLASAGLLKILKTQGVLAAETHVLDKLNGILNKKGAR